MPLSSAQETQFLPNLRKRVQEITTRARLPVGLLGERAAKATAN
jgi:hypothetical protein